MILLTSYHSPLGGGQPQKRGDDEGLEVGEEGGAGEDVTALPARWERVVVPPPGRSYLWSPAVDSEGEEVKRLKVYTFSQMQCLQGPSPRYPHGRFHEIEKEHFSWNSKRVRLQVKMNLPTLHYTALYCIERHTSSALHLQL